MKNQLTRRDFIRLCGISSIGLALAACGVAPTPTPAPTNTSAPTNAPLPTAIPTLTNTPVPTSTATATATPTATATATKTFEQWAQTNMPDTKLLTSVETQYAKALGIDAKTIETSIVILKGVNGSFAAVIDKATGYPLLVSELREGEYIWNEVSQARLSYELGKPVGVSRTGAFLRPNSQKGKSPELLKIRGQYGWVTTPDLNWTNPVDNSAYAMVQIDANGNIKYDFRLADYVVNEAIQRGQQVNGFGLFWGKDVPDAILKKGFTSKSDLFTFVDEILTNVVGHFKGKISMYSLINEYFGDAHQGGGDFWKVTANKLGISDIDFLSYLYDKAKAIDKNAEFIFNDYAFEIPGTKSYNSKRAVETYDLVSQLAAKGKIDGIGAQTHLYSADFQTPQQVEQHIQDFTKTIQKYRALGIRVYCTELNVRGGHNNAQDETYRRIMRDILPLVDGIIIWGINDDDTSYPNELATPYTAQNQPTSAFYSMNKGILDAIEKQTGIKLIK